MRTAIPMLRRTVRRMADQLDSGGCPCCAAAPYVSLREGQEAPTCKACGRELPAVRIVKCENFYGNKARMDALKEV